MRQGFTLIELSIVLVIIGLIVGGILVGQDLIKAAEVRAQVSQIEKYNSAVNTFRGKFGGLPGDLPLSYATKFGFVTTNCDGVSMGSRDGNGILDGWPSQTLTGQGETELFWEDLSSPAGGNLIDQNFPNSSGVTIVCNWMPFTLTSTAGSTYLGDYLPTAKIGHGNYISIYENSGYNWYSLSQVTSTSSGGVMQGGVSLPVIQTYNIDKKMDDGLPLSGSVQAIYISNAIFPTAPTSGPDTTTSCFNTNNNTYSISSLASYGANGNCALSFRFQ